MEDEKDVFSTGIRCVKSCSEVEDKKWSIVLTQAVWEKSWALYDEFKHDEWLGYLLGAKKDSTYEINGILIPKQEVNGWSVDVDATDPACQNPRIVGTIHSHVQMGTFFSGTDDTYIGANHDVMIVISKGEYKAQVRTKTPCGMYKVMPAEVEVLYPRVQGIERFVSSVKGNIQKNTHAQRYQGGYGGYGGMMAGWDDSVYTYDEKRHCMTNNRGETYQEAKERREKAKEPATQTTFLGPSNDVQKELSKVSVDDEHQDWVEVLRGIGCIDP